MFCIANKDRTLLEKDSKLGSAYDEHLALVPLISLFLRVLRDLMKWTAKSVRVM